MITDASVLRPDVLPQELHHRDGQIDHLSSALEPVTTGSIAENVCIFGPSGAGKTTTAKYTLKLLEREALDFRWGYATGVSESSKAGVLHRLVRDAELGGDLRREGTPTSVALDRLRDFDGQFIAVIDEADVIDDPSVFLSLYDIPNVSLVLITVDEDDFFAELGSRTTSRLRSAEIIRLEKYSHEELVDILDGRIEHGLVASQVPESAVDHIADLAAGDARRAIAILRRAARYVEQRDMQSLTCEVVNAIEDEAVANMRDRRVSSLGTHQRLLYEIINEGGRISPEELHERYEQQAQNPKAKPTRRTYLQSLERYELIESHGCGRGTEYLPITD